MSRHDKTNLNYKQGEKTDRRHEYRLAMDDSHGERADNDLEERNLKHLDRPGWRSLFAFTRRRHLSILFISISLSTISGAIVPATAIIFGRLFNTFSSFGADQITGSAMTAQVSKLSIALAIFGATGWALNGGYFMSWLVFGELQAQSVRDGLFDGLLEREIEWYDTRKNGIGALMPRLQSQIRELQIGTSQPLGFAIQYIATTLVALGVALYYSWNLTLVTLATMPLTAVVLSYLSGKIQPSIEAQSDSLSEASKLAANAISAIETVKCYNGQTHEVRQYSKQISKAAKYYLLQARANAVQIGFLRLTTLGMFVQGFWYGSTLVNSGNKNAGQILTCFWSCLLVSQAVGQIMPQIIVLEKAKVAAVALKWTITEFNKGKRLWRIGGYNFLKQCDGDIHFRNVSFAYPSSPNRHALKHVNLFCPAGETTFVVGRSGSGKSTLGNLLLRLYNPESGDIAIDGLSIRTLNENWLRENITLVQQQGTLFNETIAENIALGLKDYSKVSKEDIKGACQFAMLQNTINNMPSGLDTVVGAGGRSLSGGQKQRVAIARARLRDTPILILDESTSALDHISRSLVMDAIRHWRRGKNKTTIIITHDVSQISREDYVYVMDSGRVVQEGFRSSLERSPGGPFTSLVPQALAQTKYTQLANNEEESLPLVVNSFNSLSTYFEGPEMAVPHQNLDIPRSPSVQSATVLGGSLNYGQRFKRSSLAVTVPHLAVPEDMELVELTGQITAAKRTPVSARTPSRALLSPQLASDVPPTSPVWSPSRVVRSGGKAIASKRKTGLQQNTLLKRILWTVWPALPKGYCFILTLGFISAVIHAAAVPMFAFCFAKLLSTFHEEGDRIGNARRWSLAVLGVAIVDAIASYSMHFLLECCGQKWVDTLRIQALGRIMDQPRVWFDREENSQSRLTEYLDRNAEEMRNLIGRFAAYILVAVTMMSLALIWSLIVCWQLTLVALGSAPVIYLITTGFENTSMKWERRSNLASEAAASVFSETFLNIKTVRVLTLEKYMRSKHVKTTNKAFQIGLKRAALSGFFFGLSDTTVLFVTAAIFYYGARLASSNRCSTNHILLVFTMLLFSISNVHSILGYIPQINSSRDTAANLIRLAHLPRISHERSGATHILLPTPIILKDLSFAYPTRPREMILRDLNLEIPSGSCTAIVGASGSGKSTVASLLLRLYTPSSSCSKITLAGNSINDISINTLRSQIRIVSQSSMLFPTSVAENISYGQQEGNFQMIDIEGAARAAGVHDFILSLPLGYATRIGDGGQGLSGGQAQRIAIARAFLGHPKVIILDEATSALDTESAAVVRRSIIHIVKERQDMTVIVITHDKEMMKVAERIVVLDKGKVVEGGNYEDLARKEGQFSRLIGAR